MVKIDELRHVTKHGIIRKNPKQRKKEFIEQARRAVLSFRGGDEILKKVDRWPKYQQFDFYNEFNRPGISPRMAFVEVSKKHRASTGKTGDEFEW